MLRRMAALLLAVAVIAFLALRFPLDGKVWSPAQIESATMDGRLLPVTRHSELFWDAQRSRLGGYPSKCVGFVTMVLKNGAVVEVRLRQSIALENWQLPCS